MSTANSATSGGGNLAFYDNTAGLTLVVINSSGNFGIGTTSPYAALSVAGQVVADSFFATSTTATSTFSGGLVGNGQTVLDNLQIGVLTFNTDAGAVSWMDLPTDNSAPAGMVQSY